MGQEQDFFNQLAEQWDELRSPDQEKIAVLVAKIGLSAGDHVLDVGSGTGVLLPFLSQAIGQAGHITAIDFAEQMIARSREKHCHLAGISYVTGDILLFEPELLFNSVICLNVYPHMREPSAFLAKMKKVLVPGGSLIIMHDRSREEINAIHRSSDPVKKDRLQPVETVAAFVGQCGYEVREAIETSEYYFLKASWLG